MTLMINEKNNFLTVSWLSGLLSAEIFISTGEWGVQMPPLTSENSYFLRSGPQGATLVMSYLIPCAFSGATEPASVSHDRRETVNIRTWPTISPAHMPSGHPGAQELSHWDGPCSGFVCEWCGSRRFLGDSATHLLTDKDGVRRGHHSNCQVVNGLSTSCQPVNDRHQTAHQAMQTSSFDHGHCKHGYHWSRKVDSGLMTYLSVYCHNEQQVRFRKRQQASLVLKQLYCCLYKIEG